MPSVVLRVLVLLAFWIPCILSAEQAHSDSSLTVQLSAEPTQYDPLLLEDYTALYLSSNTVGTLYTYDHDGNLQKSLIEHESLSRDRRRYTFRFKKNLKWSDGVPFHAKDFVFALHRLTESPIRTIFFDLLPAIDLQKTKALDATHVEVALKEPDALFLDWLALAPLAPIRPDLVQTIAQKHTPVVATLAAYRVDEYKRDERLILKKNPLAQDAQPGQVDEIKILFMKDEGALLPLMRSKKIDILSRVPTLQTREIESIATVARVPVQAVTYLAFNTRKSPFNDLKNRRDFRDAFGAKEKYELVEALKTEELPALFFLPQSLTNRDEDFTPSSQKESTKPAQNLTFTIQSDLSSRNQTLLEFVQNRVKKKYDWKPKLDLMEWKAHYSKLKSQPDEVYRFGWLNPIADPVMMYQVFTTHSPNNFTGWGSEAYDRLVTELRNETRAVKRAALISSLEKILWQEAPMIPLLQQVLRFAYSKRVVGFRANPFGVILFRELRLNEDKTKTN